MTKLKSRRRPILGAAMAVFMLSLVLGSGLGAQAKPLMGPYAAPKAGAVGFTINSATTRPHVSANAMTFDHAAIIDPFHLIGEPDIAVDSVGGIYTSGPGSTPTQSSWFWKSEDGGIQWHPIGVVPEFKSNGQNGGGDTELTIDKNDNVYGSDLQTLSCNSAFRSTDHGHTFTTSEACLPGTDRQWMANYTDANGNLRIYLSANETALGCYYLVSTDGGVTYLPSSTTTLGVVDGGGCVGRMAIDQRNGTIYQPMGDGTIEKSTDGAVTWTVAGTSGAEGNFFSSLAVDKLGNLYQAWVDIAHAYMSISKDGGKTWAKYQVNRPALKQMLFPWPVVGDPGRVSMVYYGTTDTGETGGYPGSDAAVWNVYASTSTNALAAHPKFTEVQVNEHPFHYHAICTGGFPGCLVDNADRSLADFFMVTHDNDGRLLVVYNDNDDIGTVSGIGKAYVVVSKERTGPSLFAKHGGRVAPPVTGAVKVSRSTVHNRRVLLGGTAGLPPGNWTTDRVGDAMWPAYPAAGPNVPAMDIVQSSAADDGANLTFRMEVGDLSQTAQAQAVTSAGEPTWVFTWWSDHAHYFARWRGGSAFEYGTVGSIDFPQLGAPAPKFLTYIPSGVATGSVEGNFLSITVPTSGVGSPPRGAKLDHITAYTWSEHGPIPSVVDMAKTYSYILGTPAAAQHSQDGYVQISVDDPTFRHAGVASVGEFGWSFTTPSMSAGAHTIYLRQVLSSALYAPAPWDDVAAGPVLKLRVTVH